MKRIITVLAVLSITVGALMAQEKEKFKPVFRVGINALYTLNYTGVSRGSYWSGYFGGGVSFEAQLTRRSGMGIEIGFLTEELNTAILYRYYGGVLNFNAGVVIAIDDPYDTQRYRDVSIGTRVGISKDIRICKGLYIEPEIHLASMFIYNHTPFVFGAAIGLKYKF